MDMKRKFQSDTNDDDGMSNELREMIDSKDKVKSF